MRGRPAACADGGGGSLRRTDECHQPRVARTAPGRIGLSTDVMAERVDTEGAVLHDNHARYAGNKECAKRRSPARPCITIAAGSARATLAPIQ